MAWFRPPVRPRLILQSLFILLLVAVAVWIVFFSDFRPRTIGQLRQELLAFGVWGPLVMVVLHAASVVLLIPGFLMVLATALIYGLDSIWISMVGQGLGSLAAYGLGRLLGRDVFHAILGRRVVAIERVLERHGFYYLLYLRLMAVVPLPLVAYGPGLVRVPFRQVLLATLLGQAPFIIVLALFVDSARNIQSPADLASPLFLLPLLFLVALLVLPTAISLVIRRARRRRIPGAPDPPPEGAAADAGGDEDEEPPPPES